MGRMSSRSRARGGRAAATEAPAPDPNPPGVIDSLLSGLKGWGSNSSEQPQNLKPRARPVRDILAAPSVCSADRDAVLTVPARALPYADFVQ